MPVFLNISKLIHVLEYAGGQCSVLFTNWYFVIFVLLVGFILWNKRHLNVNCWFCGKDSSISRSDASWWYCIWCEQYNGFNKDGDYLHEISDMFNEEPNREQFSFTEKKPEVTNKTNLLCETCTRNQARKIEELSSFVPSNEKYYELECTDFELFLNEKYKLCLSCRSVVSYHLQQQGQQIRYVHQHTLGHDDGPRKLKANNFKAGSIVSILISCVHIWSLVMAILLYTQHNLHTNIIDIILWKMTLIFLTLNLLMFFSTRSLPSLSVLILFVWLFAALYTNHATNDSHQLKAVLLPTLLTLEVACVFNRVFCFGFKIWNDLSYMKERKRKINKHVITPTKINRHVKTKEKSEEITAAISSQHINEENYMETTPATVEKHSVTTMNITPDLLHGHLDAMYIERNLQQDQRPEDKSKKEVNHVVAALRYKSSEQHLSQLSTSKPPLIRPAVFTISYPDNKKKKESNNTSKCFEITNLEQKRNTNSNSNVLPTNTKHLQTGKLYRKNDGLRFNWQILLIAGFVISVGMNMYFGLKSK